MDAFFAAVEQRNNPSLKGKSIPSFKRLPIESNHFPSMRHIWMSPRITSINLRRLSASAGVSYNKALAKIASDWKKPDGLTTITPEQAPSFLDKLPVRKFSVVGPVTAARMKKLGIHTGGDLKKWPLWQLIDQFGRTGSWYYDLCRGIDTREVVAQRTRKSMSRECTFHKDKNDLKEMIRFLAELSESVWKDMEKEGLRGKTVTIKVKYTDFRQITRSRFA